MPYRVLSVPFAVIPRFRRTHHNGDSGVHFSETLKPCVLSSSGESGTSFVALKRGPYLTQRLLYTAADPNREVIFIRDRPPVREPRREGPRGEEFVGAKQVPPTWIKTLPLYPRVPQSQY